MNKVKPKPAEIRGVQHIGVVVRDLEAGLARWSALLGAKPGPVEEMPERGVRLAHLRFPRSPEVELLSPLGPDSPLARFLEKRGEGIQHISLDVENIAASMQELKRAGVEFISDRPLSGAGGSLIVFVRPGSFNGVLLELRQARKGRVTP